MPRQDTFFADAKLAVNSNDYIKGNGHKRDTKFSLNGNGELDKLRVLIIQQFNVRKSHLQHVFLCQL